MLLVGVGYRGVKKGHVFKLHRCEAQFVRNVFLVILVPILLKSDENSEGAAIFSFVRVGFQHRIARWAPNFEILYLT